MLLWQKYVWHGTKSQTRCCRTPLSTSHDSSDIFNRLPFTKDGLYLIGNLTNTRAFSTNNITYKWDPGDALKSESGWLFYQNVYKFVV